MTDGRAALFHGPGAPFEVSSLPIPEPAPGSVVVRVTRANICGSDVHAWAGHYDLRDTGATLPTILGHEACGMIAALGEGVAEDSAGAPLSVDDRVVFSYFTHCGRCQECLRGRVNLCLRRQVAMWGSAFEAPHFVGTFADYYYAPPGTVVLKAPDDVPDAVLAGANCALAQVISAITDIGIEVDDKVVIQGAGGLGLFAAAVARDHGAGEVIVIDGMHDRLELARGFGATVTVSMDEHSQSRDRVRQVRRLTGGTGADVVIEVAGVPAAFPEGLSMVRAGGRHQSVGNVGSAETVPVNPARTIVNNLTLKGSCFYPPGALADALHFLSRHSDDLPLGQLSGEVFSLEDIDQALAAAQGRSIARPALTMI